MSKYKLTIDLATLNHLGIGLYSNIPAVLSEAVANSWDADARVVDIDIDTKGKKIVIRDDGWGMSEGEINDRFLKVGYRKREDKAAKIPEGRQPMGRKGIGKLALFSVAKRIEVHSVKLDVGGQVAERNGFIMHSDHIEKSIKAGRPDYEPESVDVKQVKIKKGTEIVLSELNKDADVAEAFLRRRLSRRFSVIGKAHNFNVRINGKPITVEDRDYSSRMEYIWYAGQDGKAFADQCTNVLRKEVINGMVDEANGFKITGWVGTISEHKSVEEGNNGIVILARGKVIHENILPDLKEGRVFSKYIMGELRADFLDLDNSEDIATSDRQSVKETD
ncbi:MAG: ATP-binding protein, partial [Candidatus Omnitrophica bacterium]|nr:ATP-binding protein [Candidatus Omnitrophota bacterium]